MVLPATAGCGIGNGGSNTSSEGSAGRVLPSEIDLPAPFMVPLPIPPVLEPVRSDDEADHYEITQREADVAILPGRTTRIWGYEGISPGPTVIARRGRRTVVTHRNELPVPTVVHLHGGRTAPEHDGFPTDLLHPVTAPAETTRHPGHASTGAIPRPRGREDVGTKEYAYENDQPAATLWYHDHRMDFTGPQVWRGLAGFHLVGDDEEDALGLPTGDRDIPLMIADRSFGPDGQLAYPSLDPSLTGAPGVREEYMSGVLGDCLLVNGAPWPVLEVAAVRYRLRLLNASNARRYRLRLDRGPAFVQVGSDLGLLAAPVVHEQLEIAQAERYDVVVDFTGHDVGDEITMVNEYGDAGTTHVMKFVVTGPADDPSRVPDRLVALDRVDEDDVVAQRDLVFARGGAEHDGMTLWTVNGEAFSASRPLFTVRSGSTERWTIRAQNVEHPIHVHAASMRVLSRDGGSLRATDSGWKDTIGLDNGGRADVLITFDAGYEGRYVLHCHNLEHEDMMMMASFDVV